MRLEFCEYENANAMRSRERSIDFDEVQVRRIWRQIEKLAAMGTQSLSSVLVVVGGKVVEDHHGSRLDLRDQDLADPGCEGGAVHCAL